MSKGDDSSIYVLTQSKSKHSASFSLSVFDTGLTSTLSDDGA